MIAHPQLSNVPVVPPRVICIVRSYSLPQTSQRAIASSLVDARSVPRGARAKPPRVYRSWPMATEEASARPAGGGEGVSFAKQDVDAETFCRVLRRATEAVDQAAVDYVMIGGVASAVHGRSRWSNDVDLLVRPVDAERALEALAAAGFATAKSHPGWLYKATRESVVIDVIFRVQDAIYLDDEMLAQSTRSEFRGCPIRVAAPEDIVMTKVA